ncbi:40175_t:CDS:2, partial [Gigaspora margarita]
EKVGQERPLCEALFHNYVARDTRRLGATINLIVDVGSKFVGLCGQETFMENYFATQREHIFRKSTYLCLRRRI